MSDRTRQDDPDEQLVLNVLDSDEIDPAVPPAGPPELVGELVRVRAIMQAFDSLGMTPPATPPPIPSWGPFTLREQVGRGRFGTVCRAFDPAVQRDIAVKLYAGHELPAEPRLMARVRHPNVVTVFGAAVHEGHPGIWMEFIHGHTLGHRVQADGPLSPDEVLRIGIALCDALAAVHGAQLIHQDVKARNVMQEDSGRVVLMDFGAGLSSHEGEVPERFSGTPVYMAPEVVLGQRPSVQSDIYSLGVLLYYLLTGTYPVYAPDLEDLRRLHERHHRAGTRRFVATLHELRPEVSPALARCLAKALAPTDHRYETAHEFDMALERVRLGRLVRPRQRARFWAALCVAGVMGTAAGLWLRRPQPSEAVTLQHLTRDEGLSTDPALSFDGKLLAYASDRSGDDNLDIWLQMSGGEALRLTKDPADDSQPSFSPDGSKIVFRSERSSGGVYLVPTLGGEARLIAKGGRWPRFSPNGRYIAYIDESSSISLLSAEGRFVRSLRVKTPPEAVPVWSPDSSKVMVVGEGLAGASSEGGAWDWVLLDVERPSASVFRTGASDILGRLRQSSQATRPSPWAWTGNSVFFEAALGDVTNLWKIDIDGLRIHGHPRQLTTAAEADIQPSTTPGGQMVFATQSGNFDLWELTLRADSTAMSVPHKLSLAPSTHLFEGLSEDGRWLTFVSQRNGNAHVWLKDFKTGSCQPVSNTLAIEDFPVIKRDGSGIFYQAFEGTKTTLYYVDNPDGQPEVVCEDCGFATDVSPDGRSVLLQHAYTGYSDLEILDRTSGRRTTLLKHPEYTLYRGHFSSDGRWILFHAARNSGGTQEFIAPYRGFGEVPSAEWIPVTNGRFATDTARWSLDGNVIYYTSTRDGYRCIWAQRVDPTTKQPREEPFAVFHAHGRQRSIANVPAGATELAVSRDKIIFGMGELKGNIWSAKLTGVP